MEKKKLDKRAIAMICINICLLGLLTMTIVISTPIREHISVTGKNSWVGLTNEDHIVFSFDTKETEIIGLDIVCYQIKTPAIYGNIICTLYSEKGNKLETYRVPVANVSVREEEVTINFDEKIKGKYQIEISVEEMNTDDEIGICIDKEVEKSFKVNDNECEGMISYGFIVESQNHPYTIYVLFISLFFNMLVESYRRKDKI